MAPPARCQLWVDCVLIIQGITTSLVVLVLSMFWVLAKEVVGSLAKILRNRSMYVCMHMVHATFNLC